MRIECGDCLDLMAEMADNSVDLIATDPPYFKVKNEPWDRQWAKPDAFLAWLDDVLAEFHRLLKPNGSLYLFASPQMAARVEVLVGERFNVLNRINWRKDAGKHRQCSKEGLRAFFPQTEAVIFAEHQGADNIAKGEAGYEAKCDELRGFVFEPLRAYIRDEVARAGLTREHVRQVFADELGTKGKISGHYFDRAQWELPTREHYGLLQKAVNSKGGDYLKREYDDLKREYEELRQEYEELRRPFAVSADVPYTDVWDFPTVQPYPGKHPCEKPVAMMRHIVSTSSRPSAVVLDPFMGSGSTAVACAELGRDFIGFDLSAKHVAQAKARIEQTQQDLFAA